MTKVLFRFVKQIASLAKKYSDAAMLKVSNPTGNRFAGWKHVVLHYLRIEQKSSYENLVDLASEMDRVRALLQLPPHGFPDPSTLYRSFNRVPMAVWRGLLGRSSALLERSGQTAMDLTVFERWQAWSHYSHGYK